MGLLESDKYTETRQCETMAIQVQISILYKVDRVLQLTILQQIQTYIRMDARPRNNDAQQNDEGDTRADNAAVVQNS